MSFGPSSAQDVSLGQTRVSDAQRTIHSGGQVESTNRSSRLAEMAGRDMSPGQTKGLQTATDAPQGSAGGVA